MRHLDLRTIDQHRKIIAPKHRHIQKFWTPKNCCVSVTSPADDLANHPPRHPLSYVQSRPYFLRWHAVKDLCHFPQNQSSTERLACRLASFCDTAPVHHSLVGEATPRHMQMGEVWLYTNLYYLGQQHSWALAQGRTSTWDVKDLRLDHSME